MKLPADPPLKDLGGTRVRIRGIYTTALTKFFLENDYEIVQPSDVIKERLSLDENPLSPHIDIRMLKGRKGVLINCLSSYVEDLRELFQKEFKDVIIHQKEAEKGGIYKAIVHRPSPKGGYILRLTTKIEAWLPPKEVRDEEIDIGDIIIVEVQGIKSKVGIPRVSKKIKHAGDFAILLPKKEGIKISHKLSKEERERLYGLGEVLSPDEWGILWRTGARDVGIEKLKSEIDRLTAKADEFTDSIDKTPSLTKLRNGFLQLRLSFPGISKRKLDSIRRKVVPTIQNHHQFKSLGEKYSLLVDFTESKLSELVEMSNASEMVNECLFNRIHHKGKELPIFHKKLSGREIILGPATIVESKKEGGNWKYATFRRFEAGGIYDGIKAKQESGDIGITLIELTSDRLITLYFDMRENLKGIYVNINTPIELYKDGIGYYDLEIDVVLDKEGEVKIIDRERLEDKNEQHIISDTLLHWAKNKAKNYKTWLRENVDELVNDARGVIKDAK